MNLVDSATLAAFLLVLFRLSALTVSGPFFGVEGAPMRLRVGLAFVLSFVIYPLVPKAGFVAPTNTLAFVLLIFKELLVGFLIGYMAEALFAGVMMAGQLVGFQMGLALAATFDPNTGGQSSLTASFYRWIALMVFLALNGHHIMLSGVVNSYKAIGLGAAAFDGNVLQLLIHALIQLFQVAIQVSAPVAVVLFFTNALLAILGRAMPQMNIFLVGLPLTLALGFLLLLVTAEGVVTYLPNLVTMLGTDVQLLIRALTP